MYKLLAVDMDGTLLKEDKTISKMTFKAIQDARKKGVRVVLSSGRSIGGITHYLKDLNLLYKNEYVVTMNGCAVQEAVSEKYFYKKTLNQNDIKSIVSLGKSLNATIVLVADDCYYVDSYSDFLKNDAGLNSLTINVIDFDNIPENKDIYKAMFVNDKKFLDNIIPLIPSEFRKNYTVIRSGDTFFEFINRTSNKGTAVKYVAEMLGIVPEEVICIGDAENDTHMIKYAGLGVAMGNAYPSVKQAADYITKTNEEDGVAHVIHKFILEEEAI